MTILDQPLEITNNCLNLSWYHLNDYDCYRLYTKLKYKPLSKLIISNCNITNKGCKYIGLLLKINPHIKELYMGHNNYDINGIKYILNSLTKNKTLSILNIYTPNLTQDSTQYIEQQLKSLTNIISVGLFRSTKINEYTNRNNHNKHKKVDLIYLSV